MSGTQKVIRLVADNSPASIDALEFIKATNGFTASDRFAVRVLLEDVKTTFENEGVEAAMAILDRVCERPRVLMSAASRG